MGQLSKFQQKGFCSTIIFQKIYKTVDIKICVYLAFLIARLQISNCNKKLCCQSKLILNCCLLLIKSIKLDTIIHLIEDGCT